MLTFKCPLSRARHSQAGILLSVCAVAGFSDCKGRSQNETFSLKQYELTPAVKQEKWNFVYVSVNHHGLQTSLKSNFGA
jgi:hypothetical protein